MANILLVDDNDLFREAIQKLLTDKGHTVTPARSGKLADAIQRKTASIDLVISDIRMPDLDGRDLTRRIRSRSKVPVILITGFGEIAETLDAYEVGANAFLAKPFQSKDLFETIDNCLSSDRELSSEAESYSRLSIEDFAQGRQIRFPIFVRLSDEKYVRIAHNGEDLSSERIHSLRQKGVNFLYLNAQDFKNFVGQQIEVSSSHRLDTAMRIKKLELLRHCAETLDREVRVGGLNEEEYQAAKAFVEATIDIVSDNVTAVELLETLKNHTDDLLRHSLGVSLYSVMMAQQLDWNLPQNRFKVALGGLLHDIGEKEIGQDMLKRSRREWTLSDVRHYESHPLRGLAILESMSGIPLEVKEIVKQHHEHSLPRGVPTGVNKSAVHPMAKLITVADEFCYRVLRNSDHHAMTALEALQEMKVECADVFDQSFIDALAALFKADSVG
jgi:putative nucleotidyltransferase with HDIG domain